MNIDTPIALLGGLSPRVFMQRHWQKKPMVIRQAIPGFVSPLDRLDLLKLAARPEVESRLIVQPLSAADRPWRFRHGPLNRRSLPPFKQTGWTVLVQGVDLHDERIHALLNQFRFIPSARLDDLMISYATDLGGVGPHFDSYDVFLLQAQGQRRWRIGRQKDLTLRPNMPLKILAQFEPEMEFVLDPGDMLYLPPRYAHDGIARGECITYSVGFRSPSQSELAGELLQRLAQDAVEESRANHYRDPKQAAVSLSGEIPATMVEFAKNALACGVRDPIALQRVLGEYLTEPKATVCFDGVDSSGERCDLKLDRRTRMLYDAHHIFLNGESFWAGGRDARLMRKLADARSLAQGDVLRLSTQAWSLLMDWIEEGWVHAR